jgi:CspA family cold shock protein
MTSSTDTVTSSTTSERLIGRVKWFNNKAGYGFITVTDGSRSGSDVFVHHSVIQVENQQYKYLVQGEYIEFGLSNTPSGNHEFQAANVAGIKGGKLMCETRREFKISRSTYKGSSADQETLESTSFKLEQEPVFRREPRQKTAPSETYTPRARGEGPRYEDKKEWTLVTGVDKKVAPKRGRPPRSTVQVTSEPK